MENGFTRGRDDFEAVREGVSRVFHLKRRFPEMVFRKPSSRILFCEYGAALSPELWPAFQCLARLHGDDRINLLVVEPDFQSHYLEKHGVYPGISLSVESSEDEYWNIIGHEPESGLGGAIYISADVIAITGTSGAWGCWGERNDEILAVQGISENISDEAWCDKFGPFFGASEALEKYVSPAFHWNVKEWYSSSLISNYECR